jgi:hypothetical protein
MNRQVIPSIMLLFGLSLDVFPAGTGVVAPTVPGLEFTLPTNRLHFVVRENRLHYTIPTNRMHFTIPEED